MKLHKTQWTDTRVVHKDLGRAQTHTQVHAVTPKVPRRKRQPPAVRRPGAPPARRSHPLLLPLTTNAAGPGRTAPGRAAPAAGLPGGPGRPGPRGPACARVPSPRILRPGREVRLALRRRPPRLGPPPPAAPAVRPACVPVPGLLPCLPTRAALRPAAADEGEGASSPAPTHLPAAGARPPASPLRRSPGGAGPAATAGASPSSRPLPGPARSRCGRGARTCSRRAGLHGGGGGRWGLRGGGTREGEGAGDRRTQRIELRPRPARAPGELAWARTGRPATDGGDERGT